MKASSQTYQAHTSSYDTVFPCPVLEPVPTWGLETPGVDPVSTSRAPGETGKASWETVPGRSRPGARARMMQDASKMQERGESRTQCKCGAQTWRWSGRPGARVGGAHRFLRLPYLRTAKGGVVKVYMKSVHEGFQRARWLH